MLSVLVSIVSSEGFATVITRTIAQGHLPHPTFHFCFNSAKWTLSRQGKIVLAEELQLLVDDFKSTYTGTTLNHFLQYVVVYILDVIGNVCLLHGNRIFLHIR